MKSRLTLKFVIGYVFVLLSGFIIISLFIPGILRKDVLEEQNKEMKRIARLVRDSSVRDMYSVSSSGRAISMTLDEFDTRVKTIAEYTNMRIIILDAEDYGVITDSDRELSEIRYKKIYDFGPMPSGKAFYQEKDLFGYLDSDYLTIMEPIDYMFRVVGYVTVNYSASYIEDEVNRRLGICYIVLLIVFVLSGVFFLIYEFEIHLPINRILKATRKFEQGDYSARIKPHDVEDDLGKLSTSLNYVATEFGEIEEYQKSFIANVSHDFRSPLTSIKGYLEAMLDGTIPQEMQPKYLNIVITETDRLNKLTNSILTLGGMDRKSVQLDITEFKINDVIKQIIGTFEGTCRNKGIQFELIFSDSDIVVKADLEKIRQVLYNLIDNAIKFSNNNSSIRIGVNVKGDKAYVSVKDYGIGIPKEDIPKIWDRFYKSDHSRGKDKKGTGLGLCIVKDIINAHKSTIDVISTVSAGTEFVFFLPLVKKEVD